MSTAQIKVWHKCFKDGWESVESDPRSGKPASDTWECWTCMGCSQQRLMYDSVRTRSWSGDSKNYGVQDFDTGSWHEMCHGKICFTASTARAEDTVLQLLMTWFNHCQWTRFDNLWLLAFPKTKIIFERAEISDHQWDSGKYDGAADRYWENCVWSQSAYSEGDWGITVICTMFLVSFTFFNKCLYFSQHVAGYFQDRPHMFMNKVSLIYLLHIFSNLLRPDL